MDVLCTASLSSTIPLAIMEGTRDIHLTKTKPSGSPVQVFGTGDADVEK
jgi:hypothetical protein